MTDSRRAQLEAMLQDDPTDSFLRYALAMELRKSASTQESLAILDGLMNDAPPHVPSFLMAAQQLVESENIAEARSTLRRGIDVARKQDEAHAAAEMSELLTSLGEYGD